FGLFNCSISSTIYTCNYDVSESSDCKLSNIHLAQGATVGFHANNKSPTRVTLQRSYLQFLPKSLIVAFPAMEYLNLENLRIRNFDPNAFESAVNLLSVNLQMNRLEEISRNAFTGARSVVQLDLSNNQIEFIDEFAFNAIDRLKNLNVSKNKITYLPAFSKNNDLETVNASYNLLSDVSDDHFVSNKQLRTVDIAHNRLTHLDLKQLDASTNLETIYLSFNELKRLHIPKHVKHLFAKNNSIEKVSARKCVAETLHLAANKLQTHLDVSNCKLLRYLDLSNNLLQSFSYRIIARMTKLQSLYLSNNLLLEIDLPLRISPVSGLKVLDLSHNRIIHVPSTNAFGTLETLQLSHNELQQFDFSKMNQLQKAFLSSNQWDCSVLQGIRVQLSDRDPDSCAEGFRKTHGICCKDYKQPYGDTLAAITRNNFIHDLRTMHNLKELCSVPAINRTVDQQTRENLEKLSKIAKVKNNLQANLDATLQVRLNLTKTYETISASLQSVRGETSAITDIIERQRKLENSANSEMLTRDGKSDLEVLQEILLSMVAARRSSYNSLRDYRQYIANIPYRIHELKRAIPQLKHHLRTMHQDLTMLEHKEKSMILHYQGLSRMVQNVNYERPRFNAATTSEQQSSQGGVYSEQRYRYEYHSSNIG
ncbi:leucine-rich repeat-containing G-protein coupled receptor 5-like, partial [Ochlerotatus camptorhynchus]|uniref:leucine-rich repeat-containing G-protein coupled receptor 5-like n=1 Tax=Ochlerotatus camptorhynchus TaxID=644619 RepID=UPI0031D479F2